MRNVLPVLARLLRDTAYVLIQFPFGTAAFVMLVTGLAVATGTLILVVGLPLLVAVLGLARLLATGQRELVAVRGEGRLEGGTYRRSAAGSWWRRALDTVRTPQPWLDVLHGLVNFPVAVATFVVAITWWSVSLGGLTYWAWERFLPESDPDENETLSELLDLGISDLLLYLVIGVVAAVTLPYVVRLCAVVHEQLARLLLDNGRVRELELQLRDAGVAREAANQAEVDALRRLERDLHDGPQQRLVRLGMDLAVIERRMESEPESARAILAEARQQTAETLTELRALSRGIAPPILADRGLHAALLALAGRSPVPATLAVGLHEDVVLTPAVETALYFSVSEAMANVAKHSAATSATITVRQVPDRNMVLAEIVDDGTGGATFQSGHGLQGLVDRLAAVGGTLHVDSPPGGPTTVVAEVPCGS